MEHCTIGATCYGLAQVSASFFETPERATRNAEPADGGGWVIWIEAHVGSHALDGLLQIAGPHEGRSHLPVGVIRVKRKSPRQRAEGGLMLALPTQHVGERRLDIGKLRVELNSLASKLIGSLQGSSPKEIIVAMIGPR